MFSRRIYAGLLDWVIANFLVIIIWGGFQKAGVLSPFQDFTRHFVIEAIWLLYYTSFWTCRWQATPGMKITGIQIINRTGGKPDFLNALITYLVLSIFLIWYNRSGYLLALLEYDTVRLNEPLSMAETITRFIAYRGKEISFIIIGFPMFFTAGRRSLANMLGGTQVVSMNKTAYV